MVHWFVSFGCPLFLFSDSASFQYHASFSILVGGLLRTWPKYLFNIVDLFKDFFIGDEFIPFDVLEFCARIWSANLLVSVPFLLFVFHV